MREVHETRRPKRRPRSYGTSTMTSTNANGQELKGGENTKTEKAHVQGKGETGIA